MKEDETIKIGQMLHGLQGPNKRKHLRPNFLFFSVKLNSQCVEMHNKSIRYVHNAHSSFLKRQEFCYVTVKDVT